MPAQNAEIAALFNRLADLLEIEEANPFRVRAYRNAAQTVEASKRRLSEMVEAGDDLSQLPGIGKQLARKLREMVETGSLSALAEIESRTGSGLADLLAIPGLGPERVRVLHQSLGIGSPEQLAQAARRGEIRKLSGFGAKTERAILEAIEKGRRAEKPLLWDIAEPIAESVLEYLRGIRGVERAAVAGSFRRRKETIGNLGVLVACAEGTPVAQRFLEYEDVETVVSQGTARWIARLRSGLQVDLRVVPQASFGAALHCFTGSEAHRIAVRKLGLQKQLEIDEHGVFEGNERVAGGTEEEIYQRLGLAYVEPELREDRGELQAAEQGSLPRLVRLDDIRGDLHAHTRASDGRATLEELAEAAGQKGYEYLAITEHTHSLRIARGLDAPQLERELEAIDRINQRGRGPILLKSAEVEILEDGSLDLPDPLLAKLDLVVCAVHSHFRLSAEKQTERILRAMDNPHFDLLAHPTGRLIGSRDAYAVDLEGVIRAAAERGCFLELNARPERLDLSDLACKAAKEMGVKIAIATDAHAAGQLDNMRLGIAQARRGWLEPDDVLNARSWSALQALLRPR